MPARNYKCWQCRFIFVGHDVLACSVDQTCPRCGAGTRAWVATEEEKKIGLPYEDVGTGLVLRLGREHQMLFAHGYYKLKTHDSEILEVCNYGDYIPQA